MRFLLIFIFVLSLSADKVLVINSNANVKKYNTVIKAFSENFQAPFKIVDISKMQSDEIKEYLYDEYPDIVYTVGSKAYQYASKYLPEKTIFFSSIVNWKRLEVKKNHYGIANELHNGVQLTLIKAIFSEIKTIGVLYSKYTENVYESLNQNASQMGIKIIAKKIINVKDIDFNNFLQNSEAYIILPDPVLLSDTTIVEKLFLASKSLKKPIFAYDELFIQYGAILVSSVDNPTIGRQAAATIDTLINTNEEIKKVQFPIGTSIIFNVKLAKEMDIKFSDRALMIVNKIIE